MADITVINTEDGSHSLFNSILNETYHSVHGAVQESKHVFIQHGLDYWLQQNPAKDIRILEIGFGTGLNAFLTFLHPAIKDIKVYYESWEAFPLPMEVLTQLNYPGLLGSPEKFIQMHEAPWNTPIAISKDVVLHKHQGDIIKSELAEGSSFDLIYYDAFAPSKQPELWTLEVLRKVTDVLAANGVWVTYCAKGQLKRDLKLLGLKLETLSGPPGKKEMVRALR